MPNSTLPKLETLPKNFPLEGIISLKLIEGITIFRASEKIQSRIETLLEKQKQAVLTIEEEKELDVYLSLVNWTIRNLLFKSDLVGSIDRSSQMFLKK